MDNRPSIDWKAFGDRLLGIALGWFAQERTDVINAHDAFDLAAIAAVDVFEKYHETGPAKTEEELFKIAVVAMKHDLLDLIKSAANRTNFTFDGAEKGGDEHPALKVSDTVYARFEDESVKLRLYELAEGDDKLKEFIYAVTELDIKKRREIADLLNVTPQEVTNMQRKLRYRHSRREKQASKQLPV
ncbi:MAG TPA: hypothetical protein PLK77_12810 [Pyrinomonadaceae bacterium]|nr:hypothetical protein [Pyrinomonadaceae bacterium]